MIKGYRCMGGKVSHGEAKYRFTVAISSSQSLTPLKIGLVSEVKHMGAGG